MNIKIKEKFDNEGFYILKKFFFKKKLEIIKKKIQIIIEDNNNYLPIKKISAYSKKSKLLKGPNGNLKKNLEKFEIDKGLKNISKKSNSISIRDPLLKIDELNEIIFNNKLIETASYILNSKKIKLGYIKLGIFFENNLPKNCINYFHTDDLNKEIDETKKVCKFSFTLSSNPNTKNEFGILPIKKNKLKFYKQYFNASNLQNYLKKKIYYPSLQLGDAVLFDPNNFYHVANKPKKNLRIIFYVEFLGPKNRNLFNNVKISKSTFKNLDQRKKRLCNHYQLIK